MLTSNPLANFISPRGILHRQPSVRATLWPVLTGLLLVTASCGDFQDPASGVQGSHLTNPSLIQIPSQHTGGNESYMAPPPAEHQGIPASQPLPIDSLPPSTGTIGTGGNTTLNETISIPPPEQASSPPATEHIQIPNQAPADPIAQTPAQEKPETQPVTFEWSPSPSGDAAGYILRISTVSDQTDYTFNTGQETRLVVDLPKGKSYLATVLAYNIAGESPPADPIRFDLF